jgi:3-isopropylmalate/(R)-2-methylmalate dehydratase small subunit
MEPYRTLTGPAAPMLVDDLNTDQITPVQRKSTLTPDYAAMLFSRLRYKEDGGENPDFILNRGRYRDTKILVGGNNFGCGSSREGAVWALAAFGIRCVVARSFADIFRENCLKNGVLPVTFGREAMKRFEALVEQSGGEGDFTADLEAQEIRAPDGASFAFDIAPAERTALLEGLDDIGMTLKHAADVAAWEETMRGQRPWLQEARDRRSA